MKRREFIEASSLGTATVLYGLTGCTEKQTSSHSLPMSGTGSLSLEGLSLQNLKKQYKYDLFDDFLPFLDRYVIDHEYGGFMCNTDRDGTNITKNKNAWFEGRGIWVYSFLYNNLENNQKHLEAARKSVDFILKHKPAGDDLWPRSFTEQGSILSGAPGNIYGDIFIATGFSEYSRASGETRYWDTAKQILLKCIRLYDDPNYFPEASQTYLGKEGPSLPGGRIIGHWMVLLRLATQMLEQKKDPEIESVADLCVNAIMKAHHITDFDLTIEIINHDMSIPTDPLSQLVYTGHAIETFWMVLYEAVRKKDKNLFDLAAQRFKRHVDIAWDDVYGGAFRALIHVDKNIWAVDKVLWLQEEILIGSLFIIEHTGADWAKEMFVRTFLYVQDKFPLKQYGFPLWNLNSDRKVSFKRHSGRIGNFHHPRHLMLNLLSLDRMIERKGKVSGIFT